MRNIIHLTGHTGKDAEVKTFDNGGKIATFSLATTEKWKTRDGEKKERTDWHNIIVGAPSIVDVCEKYVKKGMLIEVDGSVRYREYEKDGVKHYVTHIHADRVHFHRLAEAQAQPAVRPTPQPVTEPEQQDDLPF